ncbi:MAG: hypothetical protein K2O45_12800 [Oscillospiraceae bacterium]|nr:hypothetical protein [Oscillospiraceae bacterium]
MDEQELIQVSLRLPASALDRLSALAEQLRKLTAAVNGLHTPPGALEDVSESGFFDPMRFQALRQKAEEAGKQGVTKATDTEAVRSYASEWVRDAECADPAVFEDLPLPKREELFRHGERKHDAFSAQEAGKRENTAVDDIPAVRPDTAENVPEAPVVRIEPDCQTPEAESAQVQSGEVELPLPAARADPLAGAETPQGTGMVITAHAEPPASRWSGVAEELAEAGPAPLTAEAVSLAFQRDGRRYDNGFPLY